MAEQDMQRIGMIEDDLAMQERRAKRSDQAAAFASWLNSMRMKPDANLPAQLQAAQERRASNIRKNRTVNMLEAAGQTELAKQVKSGAITGKTAVSQMFQLAAEERAAQRAAAGRAATIQAQREAADLAFQREKELLGLKAPKSYQYQQLARDLLDQGIAGSEKEALQMALSQTKAGPTVQVSYGDKGGPPEAFKELDKAFTKDALDWGKGGAADAMKNITQIKDVVTDINLAVREGRTPSGPLVGVQNDLVQSFLNPTATDIRNRVQEVVQRNLREILGAQFTQAEGLALIERAYNQRLDPEKNLRRLNALLDQMATAATAKQQMYEHFMKEGTLFGYQAGRTLPTLDELHSLMDGLDRAQGVDTSDILTAARAGAGSVKSNISEADAIVGIND